MRFVSNGPISQLSLNVVGYQLFVKDFIHNFLTKFLTNFLDLEHFSKLYFSCSYDSIQLPSDMSFSLPGSKVWKEAFEAKLVNFLKCLFSLEKKTLSWFFPKILAFSITLIFRIYFFNHSLICFLSMDFVRSYFGTNETLTS